MSNYGWYGFDLDQTLATYDGFCGIGHIGDPILATCDLVRQYLANGMKVKLVTARASMGGEELVTFKEAWAEWSLKEFGQVLEDVCGKDFNMISLYDDRAVQVIPGTGILLQDVVTKLKEEINHLKQRNQELFNELVRLQAERG